MNKCIEGIYACHENALCNSTEGSYSFWCRMDIKAMGFYVKANVMFLCEGEVMFTLVI